MPVIHAKQADNARPMVLPRLRQARQKPDLEARLADLEEENRDLRRMLATRSVAASNSGVDPRVFLAGCWLTGIGWAAVEALTAGQIGDMAAHVADSTLEAIRRRH
jgi:hypothetical protein